MKSLTQIEEVPFWKSLSGYASRVEHVTDLHKVLASVATDKQKQREVFGR
jgi:hypothetical protein